MAATTAPRPDDRHLETFLAECVRESLDNHMVANAVFLCERLHASSGNEHNTHLLATCYHRNKQPHRARAVLRGQTSERCRYLIALCCYDLGRLPEAERALVGVGGRTQGRENYPPKGTGAGTRKGAGGDTHESPIIPHGAAGLHLLGLVCKETGRRAAAVSNFKKALTLDPFSWVSREELCGLGAEAEAREAEGVFFSSAMGNQSDGTMECSTGYPSLKELGGFMEIDNSIVMTRFGSSSAVPFSLGSKGGTSMSTGGFNSTIQRPSFQFRARPVVPDSAAPPTQTPAPGLTQFATEGFNSTINSGIPPPPSFSMGLGSNVHTDIHPNRFTDDLTTPAPVRDLDLTSVADTGNTDATQIKTQGAGLPLETPSPAEAASMPPPPQKGTAHGGLDSAGGPSSTIDRHVGGGGGRGARRVFVDEGKLRKVSGRLFAEPNTTEPRRSSRLASIAGSTPGSAEGVTTWGFVTPAGGDPSTDTGAGAALAAPRLRGNRGGRGRASDASRRDSMDGEGVYETETGGAFPRRTSEDGGAPFRYPQHTSTTHLVAPGRFAEGALALRSLLSPLADAVAHLSMFRGRECIDALSRLHPKQRNTGYALCIAGKAHAEMVEYPESARAFEQSRRADPTRTESCEVYSTVLWHLRRETRLSHLAQELVSIDRLSPETWCVLGNCFSLQKEHETALRFFKRALQLDPKCSYAHTLCGHEFFANEDFEKAMTSYRAAIRIDPRHYNAWYGLGTVYYRQEKYELSEYHFRHALTINSRSSVLFCYLGMAQHALRKTDDALLLLQKAVSLDSKNPLAKYEKASVLLSDDRFQEALEELEELKTVAPREASVFFLMGRIYKKLGLQDQAMVNFSVALDLKPASADVNLIKSAIEKLHVPDDSEDEDL